MESPLVDNKVAQQDTIHCGILNIMAGSLLLSSPKNKVLSFHIQYDFNFFFHIIFQYNISRIKHNIPLAPFL